MSRRSRVGGRRMRARPLTLLTATAAVTLVLAAGSEALVEAKVYHLPVTSPVRVISQPPQPPQSQPQVAKLMLEVMTPSPAPPQTLPSGGFAQLQTRVQQA